MKILFDKKKGPKELARLMINGFTNLLSNQGVQLNTTPLMHVVVRIYADSSPFKKELIELGLIQTEKDWSEIIKDFNRVDPCMTFLDMEDQKIVVDKLVDEFHTHHGNPTCLKAILSPIGESYKCPLNSKLADSTDVYTRDGRLILIESGYVSWE